MPPDGQVDQKRRVEFTEYLNNLEGWEIDKLVKDSILNIILKQKGDCLVEFIDTFKLLIEHTDKKYDYKHYSDNRKEKPKDIKKGKYVFFIIELLRKSSKYVDVMNLYFTQEKVIYYFEIGRSKL
jgi:hypothetical protein